MYDVEPSMIFPKHCKYVGVVRGELDRTRPFYFLTEYVLQLPPAEPAVWHVKLSGNGMLRRLEDAEQIAGGDDIVIVKDDFNVFDRSKLILNAFENCLGNANTAVFFAQDGHSTFVHHPDTSVLKEVQVLDISPRNLSTLHRTVSLLDKAGAFGDMEIKFKYVSLDVSEYVGDGTVFPCEASGIGGRFLSQGEGGDVKRLVGCNISKRVLASLGGTAGDFIDFCPHTSEHFQPSAPFIGRCCRSDQLGRTTRNGQPGIIVHWGISISAVYDAVQDLWRVMAGEDAGS